MALAVAGLAYDDVEQAYAGYVFGDSTSGQKALYRLGMTGIPAFNVNNNCSTGSSALFLARQAVQSGAVDCALAIGFEQMRPGALGRVFEDKPDPFERFNREAEDSIRLGRLNRLALDGIARKQDAIHAIDTAFEDLLGETMADGFCRDVRRPSAARQQQAVQ